MAEANSSWTRLTFSPSTGRLTVDGDPFTVLGVARDDLTSASDPVSMLSDKVARALIEGGDVTKDEANSLVIIPGDTRYHNSVIVLKETPPETDLVSDVASGIVGFSPDGMITRWNKRMSYLFGPREMDVKGRKASDVLPEPVLYNWTSVISSAHMGHEVRIEFRPSGEKRVEGVLSRGGPGVIGVFYDSTENYKNSKRLRALNRLNQAYLQSTSTGLLLLDSRLRILLSNTGFSRISGERGSLIGQQLHDVLPIETYRWVHDSSERLFGAERSEQSDMVSYKRRDGSELLLKSTLRAVRNEMNQAVNFVCLFEDMTELAWLRTHSEKLMNSITGIASIAGDLVANSSGGRDQLSEKIMHLTGSSSVVRYTYDRTETMKLSGRYGNWPDELRSAEPADLGLPASVWRAEQVRLVKQTELGKLSGFFSSVVVVPIGTGVSNRGHLLLCDSVLTENDSPVLQAVSALTGLLLNRDSQKQSSQTLERYGISRENQYSSLLKEMPFPVALVKKDGSAELWNSAMEELTGISAEAQKPRDLRNILDPHKKGLTLDSLASSEIPFTGRDALVWPIFREDGSESLPHRWHVNIVEQPAFFQGDYGFLVAAVPCGEADHDSMDNGVFRRQCIDMLQAFTNAVVSKDESDVLQAVWNICSGLSRTEGLEFHRNGELFASFHAASGETPGSLISGDTGPSLLLDGVEYEVRTTGDISVPLVESVCEMLSRLRGTCPAGTMSAEGDVSVLQDTMMEIVHFLQQFCEESLRQNSAVLTMTEHSDPLAGFARTMLFSHESASRAASLLDLALGVSRESFRKLLLQKFMSGFHTLFAESGMRPPALSIAQGLPEVVIIPKVVLRGITLLCMLKSTESVLRFSITRELIDGKPEVALRIRGFEESLSEEEIAQGWQNLKQGIFDNQAETALLYRILKAAGCAIVFDNSPDCTIVFQSDQANG